MPSNAISHKSTPPLLPYLLVSVSVVLSLAVAMWFHSSMLVSTGGWIPVALSAALLITLVGVYFLKRLPVLSSNLEKQLLQFHLQETALQRVAEGSDLDAAWNSLVAHSEQASGLREIQASLEAKFGSQGQGQLGPILNSLPEGLAVTTLDGVVTLSNVSFRALGECDNNEEVNGKQIRDLLPIRTDKDKEAWEAASQEPHLPTVFQLMRSDLPEQGVLRISRSPLQGDSNQMVWVLRDITQQRLSELSREQFVNTATHELRTPLANIKAYAETLNLQEDIDVEQKKQFLNTLNAEASRLSRLVDELLDVSRMEAGALTLECGETDIARLLEEAFTKAKPVFDEREIEFERLVPPKLPKLLLDKDKIAATLVNLLGNAAKYTPEGGKVSVLVESTVNSIAFRVQDTGIGISEEELPKLFEKFFRSQDERVRDIPGSGLGLSFALQVARLHGGDLTVESEYGVGTTFTLTLPV